MENIFYTIVDAETPTIERRVTFEPKQDTIDVFFPHRGRRIEYRVTMDQQQLAELGHLMIALSQGNYDSDSINELLDGFDLTPQPKFGWGWIDGEDDNEGDKWIQISELDYTDPENPCLGEEIATIMMRDFEQSNKRWPDMKSRKEQEAQQIVDGLNRC